MWCREASMRNKWRGGGPTVNMKLKLTGWLVPVAEN